MSAPRIPGEVPGGPPIFHHEPEVKKTDGLTEDELKTLREMMGEYREEKRKQEAKAIEKKAGDEAYRRERIAELKTYPKSVEMGKVYPTLKMSGISVRGSYAMYQVYRAKYPGRPADHVWSAWDVEPIPSLAVATVINLHLSELLRNV
jgi:hypothetical protein